MITKVQTLTPSPPEQRVVLDLSVEEFAVIYTMAHQSNGGPPEGLRGVVERGLKEARADLHPEWDAKIEEATAPGESDFPAVVVKRVFRGGSK